MIKESNKTLNYLYSKGKNRFAKVLFIFIFLFVVLCIFGLTIGESGGFREADIKDYKGFLTGFFITVVIFELIRRAFYYIALGTIRPKK